MKYDCAHLGTHSWKCVVELQEDPLDRRKCGLRARDEEKRLHVRMASNDNFLVLKHVMFLVALVKLRKVAINRFLSVRLSVHMEQLDYRWAEFH